MKTPSLTSPPIPAADAAHPAAPTVSDALALAFGTEQPRREGQPPAHEGYRVHVHLLDRVHWNSL